MADIYTHPNTKQDHHDGSHPDGKGMVRMAQREVQHHTAPFPEAHPPEVDPFPRLVIAGLWFGILTGALFGLGFGALLFNGILVIPDWEGLFSMSPFTFHVFWTVIGIASGILIDGIIAMLLVNPNQSHPQ